MKKIISLVLALLLCLSIVACKNDPVKEKTPSNSKPTQSSVSKDDSSDASSSEDSVSSEKNNSSSSDNSYTSSENTSSTPTGTVTPNKKEPYSNPQGYVDVSKVVTKNGRTYIEKDGSPYNMHSIHIRPDLIISEFQLLNKKQYDVYLREYFRQAAMLGFNTVICQIHWYEIEIAEDLFDFTLWECIYSYLEEFDLNIQLLWVGSDNCGYGTDVPNYIEDDLVNYPKFDIYDMKGNLQKNASLDYSNPKLIEREKNALNKLMTWLYQYDTSHRTVAVQILNEPNAMCYKFRVDGEDTKNYLVTKEDVEKNTWVNGQKEAIYNLMNELGLVVKNGPYRCVTRVNFVSYYCYFHEVEGRYLCKDPLEVAALEGIDLVGMDSFSSGVDESKFLLTNTAEGGIPHIPEASAGYCTFFAKALNTFKIGGVLFPYELKSNAGYDKLSVFKLDLYDFIPRDGTASVDALLESKTGDWASFNKMVDAAGYMICTSSLDDYQPFNTETQAVNISATKTVGGLEVTYNSTCNDTYGGVGFAMKAADGSYLFYAQKGTTNFIFGNATLTGNISKGYYDEGGKWVETGIIAKTGDGFVVTPTQAANGTVFRILSSQLTFK